MSIDVRQLPESFKRKLLEETLVKHNQYAEKLASYEAKVREYKDLADGTKMLLIALGHSESPSTSSDSKLHQLVLTSTPQILSLYPSTGTLGDRYLFIIKHLEQFGFNAFLSGADVFKVFRMLEPTKHSDESQWQMFKSNSLSPILSRLAANGLLVKYYDPASKALRYAHRDFFDDYDVLKHEYDHLARGSIYKGLEANQPALNEAG